nr:hypothetical protein [Catenulispora pinisilvae]
MGPRIGAGVPVEGRGPAGQQVQGIAGGGGGLGAVGRDGQPGVCGQFQGVVAEGEFADDRVVDLLDAAVVQ